MVATSYTTEAICLKTTNYSDTSKIGTWLSPQHGAIRAIAKGVRGKNRQLVGACLPLSIGELQFRKGRQLDTVTQARSKQGFDHLQTHLLGSGLSYCLFATAHAFAGQQDGDDAACLYPPLVGALVAMNQVTQLPDEAIASTQLVALTLQGLLGLCHASGHAPQWDVYVDIDAPVSNDDAQVDGLPPVMKFSCQLGGVVTPGYTFTHEPPIQLTRHTWQCLRQPTDANLANHPDLDKLLGFYQHFIAHIAEHRQPLTAFDFACQLLATA